MKWIKFSEALPPIDKKVALIFERRTPYGYLSKQVCAEEDASHYTYCKEDKVHKYIAFGTRYDDNKFFLFGGGDRNVLITHWCSIPDIPEPCSCNGCGYDEELYEKMFTVHEVEEKEIT